MFPLQISKRAIFTSGLHFVSISVSFLPILCFFLSYIRSIEKKNHSAISNITNFFIKLITKAYLLLAYENSASTMNGQVRLLFKHLFIKPKLTSVLQIFTFKLPLSKSMDKWYAKECNCYFKLFRVRLYFKKKFFNVPLIYQLYTNSQIMIALYNVFAY